MTNRSTPAAHREEPDAGTSDPAGWADRGDGSTPAGAPVVAALCSMGAGVIHVAASQGHLDHRTLARTMLALGLAQLAGGIALLLRPRRAALAATLAVSVAALGGWAATRVVDIGWIAGLENAEAPQAADTLAALLAAGAAVLLGLRLLGVTGRLTPPRPALAVGAAGAVIALSLVGVDRLAAHDHSAHAVDGGSHEHGGGDELALAEGEDHGDHAEDADHADHGGESGGHGGGHEGHDTDATTDTGEPWRLDATDGETEDMQELVAVTQEAVAAFDSFAAAEAAGYVKINDQHMLKVGLVFDDKILDPGAIESLVITQDDEGDDIIVGGMYLMNLGQEMRDVPRMGGPLAVWHSHGGFCFELDGVIVQQDEETGECPQGSAFLPDPPMLHVYSEPIEDDGVARDEGDCGTFTYMDLPFDEPVPGCGPGSSDPSAGGIEQVSS